MNWFPKKKVLVPVDFSDESLEAVDVALSLVDGTTNLHVIHVGPKVVAGDPGFGWQPLEELTRRGQIANTMTECVNQPSKRGITKLHVAFGDPGSEIARFAEENGMELIVIPSHGRSGLARVWLGSVAERVLRLAHCPVLILRN